MTTNITKKTAVLATAVGLSLGGAALATADTTTSTPPSTSAPSGTYPGGNGGGDGHGPETPLTGDVAAKVKAAALAKVPGATVLRVETDAGGVYEAHLRKSDGTEVVAHVDKSYNVTSVDTRGAGGPGGGHGGHGHVDAAALAKALGVTEAKVTAALAAQHQSKDDNKGDQAAAIAKALGASTSDVQAVLDANRPAGGHRGGPGAGGQADGTLAKALADKLGTTQAKAQAALDAAHADRENAEAAALAKALGVDASKVKAALAAQHPTNP